MQNRQPIFSICFSLLAMLSACRAEQLFQEQDKRVAARVNDAVITEEELSAVLGDSFSAKRSSEARATALEDLINEELLYQEGMKLGLDQDARYRNQVALMEMRLREFKRAELARRVMSLRVTPSADVTDRDARQYFALHREAITTEYHLFILRFQDLDRARAAARAIDGEQPFEAAARVLYANPLPGLKPAWDAGYLHWNQLPPEWTEAITALPVGSVTGILQSKRTGICIIKLADKRKNPEATFDLLKESIINRMRDMRILDTYDRYIGNLRKESQIVKTDERRKAS